MKKLEIKHVRLIYDEWKCIERKSYRQKRIKNPDFSGFLALIDIEKVKEKQVWSWGKESLESGIQAGVLVYRYQCRYRC